MLCFRSLFRNTRASLTGDQRLVYGSSKWLWLFAIAFHYAFLVVVIRHLRFFLNPVPAFVDLVARVDGMFQIGLPGFYITTVVLIGALGFLLLRRLQDPQVRYMSLASDYFALFLLLGVAVSGALLRHTPARVDIVQVKELAMGIWTMNPVAVQGASALFYTHLFLVSTLLAYFPFSKLVHTAGIFFSPTRNLANDNRRVRHVNPWAPELPDRIHSYAAGSGVGHQLKSAGSRSKPREEEGESMAHKLMSREELLQYPSTRGPATGSTPPRRRCAAGAWNYAASPEALEYLGLPNPREWSPADDDWKLPENWKEIITTGIKERLDKFRSFKNLHGLLCPVRRLRRQVPLLPGYRRSQEHAGAAGRAVALDLP